MDQHYKLTSINSTCIYSILLLTKRSHHINHDMNQSYTSNQSCYGVNGLSIQSWYGPNSYIQSHINGPNSYIQSHINGPNVHIQSHSNGPNGYIQPHNNGPNVHIQSHSYERNVHIHYTILWTRQHPGGLANRPNGHNQSTMI